MEKVHQIFISSSSIDSSLASELKKHIENAFLGKVKCFVSSEDIITGSNWKDVIKKTINDCQSGIFLLTPNFEDSVWLTAEFAAFWASNKNVYLLSIGDFTISKLFEPIRDCQIIKLSDERKVRAFIKKLSDDLGVECYPYDAVKDMIAKCSESYEYGINSYADGIIQELRIGKNHRPEESDRLLSMDDNHLLEALRYLDKAPVLRNVIAKGVLQHKNEQVLLFAVDRLSLLNNLELRKAATRLIFKNAYDNLIFDHCIKVLSKNSQEQLLKVLKELYSFDKNLCERYIYEQKLISNEESLDDLFKKINIPDNNRDSEQ